MAHVIIPTKSNVVGLISLVESLADCSGVDRLTVVTDGPGAYDRIKSLFPDLHLLQVALGAGIHVMWNSALAFTEAGQHVAFVNDDVVLTPTTISGLEEALNSYPELGLVCPKYAPPPVPAPYQEVASTCGGRYDGTGGLAGFCMMLAGDLASEWRFDERMKWWCGDDDVLNWVRITRGRKAAIYPGCSCSNNESWTITHDPPSGFHATVAEDLRIYHSKVYT